MRVHMSGTEKCEPLRDTPSSVLCIVFVFQFFISCVISAVQISSTFLFQPFFMFGVCIANNDMICSERRRKQLSSLTRGGQVNYSERVASMFFWRYTEQSRDTHTHCQNIEMTRFAFKGLFLSLSLTCTSFFSVSLHFHLVKVTYSNLKESPIQ